MSTKEELLKSLEQFTESYVNTITNIKRMDGITDQLTSHLVKVHQSRTQLFDALVVSLENIKPVTQMLGESGEELFKNLSDLLEDVNLANGD
jgi:hypothetical protein